MTSLPMVVQEDQPLGIVIRSGIAVKPPAVIWAYMWAADEEESPDHWHQHVPVEHAA